MRIVMDHDFKNLTIIKHAFLDDRVSTLRSVESSRVQFKNALQQISQLLFFEATRNAAVIEVPVQTPLEETHGAKLAGDILVVPILRAGLAMSEAVSLFAPEIAVGIIGLYRDEESLEPVHHYEKFPDGLSDRTVLVLDPMLATGGSAVAAVSLLKKHGAKRMSLLSVIAAPEGVQKLLEEHPDVAIYTAVLDRQLNERGYILPGLGDAGDRYFGTD